MVIAQKGRLGILTRLLMPLPLQGHYSALKTYRYRPCTQSDSVDVWAAVPVVLSREEKGDFIQLLETILCVEAGNHPRAHVEVTFFFFFLKTIFFLKNHLQNFFFFFFF